MNLLIFVLAILLVISSISYQSLDRYRLGAILRTNWDRFMRVEATCQYNQAVEEEWRELKKTTNEEETPSTEPTKEAEKQEPKAAPETEDVSNRKLNFRFLVNPDYLEKYPQEAQAMLSVVKNLIQLLYAQHPFYQQMVQERPDVLDELFSELRQKQGAPPKINKAQRLFLLLPNDEKLQMLWYQLLKQNPLDPAVGVELGENSQCAQVSLLNYLNKGNSDSKTIRLYLAPRPILWAIFQNRENMQKVIEKRLELFREVSQEEKSAQMASAEFKAFSEPLLTQEGLKPILNYRVSKTDPHYYAE